MVEIDATFNVMQLLRMTSSAQLYMPEMTVTEGHELNPDLGGTKEKIREMIETLAVGM